MKSLAASLRVAALFVGSVVGAGFATGREIALFFGGGSLFCVLLSAAFMAFSSFVFLERGARCEGKSLRVFRRTKPLIAAASFVVYAAMLAAAEEVLIQLTALRGLSLLLGAMSLFFSLKSTEGLSYLNLLAVPVMVALVVWVGAQGRGSGGDDTRILSSFSYGAMNMLFSGAIMYEEGGKLGRGERVMTSLFIGGVLAMLLVYMYYCAADDSSMPFLVAAEKCGVGPFAPVMLLLSVFTTMTSCNYLVFEEMRRLTRDDVLSATLPFLLGMLVAAFGFSAIVNALYPVVSYLGLVFTMVSILWWGRLVLGKPRRKGRMAPIHTR